MTSPTLTFLGATGTVTGSRFLVETGRARVLVDAGLYQGPKHVRMRNWESFPVEPGSVSSVVLTHAHLDHCGYVPRLVKDGFSGPVLSTPETAELAAIVLSDSAHLLEEEAAYANKSGYSRHDPALPLYDVTDARRARALFDPVVVHRRVPAADGVAVTLRSAGHILGSVTAPVHTSQRPSRPSRPGQALRSEAPRASVAPRRPSGRLRPERS